MLPTLLTARPGPQTLLLTALALLIAAATIMLACGPAAQPIPEAGDTLAAAPQAEGNGEEPAAEPTDTPVAEKPAVADVPAQGLDAGNATPTPEVAAVAATPTPEPNAATDTPTPQPAIPTDTPTPEVLAKAAVPVPATPEKAAPQETENTESPEPTATPTPWPTVCLEGPSGTHCVHRQPHPTPKYPALGNLSQYAQEAEEAATGDQAGGVSGQSGGATPKLFVRISLAGSPDAVIAWLQSNGVPLSQDIQDSWAEGIKNRVVAIYGGRHGFLYAVVPTSLLVALSQQEGVVSMDDGCFTMVYWCYFQDEPSSEQR